MQGSIYTNIGITFIPFFIYFPADRGKERDGAAICYHHNNVRTVAAGRVVGMVMCEACIPVGCM